MTGERYKVMPLEHPDGSSQVLKDFIDWGGRAIEASLEVLGSGHTTVPDYSQRLEGDGKVVDIDEKTGGVMVNSYGDLDKTVGAAKEAIHVTDEGVDTSTFATSGVAASAFSDIQGYVAELKDALDKAPDLVRDLDNPHPQKHLTVAELGLMSAVAKAVGNTHDKVVEAQAKITQQADGIGGATPTYDTSTPSYAGNGYPTPTSGYSGGSGAGSPVSYTGSAANAQPISSGQKATAEKIYRYLRDKYGLTHNEATAILGNMQTESSFNTAAYNAAEGAIGLIQWEGSRDDALRAFAGSRAGDWKAQVDFMMHEAATSEKGNWEKFRSRAAISPAEGAAAFDQYYERSAGTTRRERVNNATAFAASIPNTASPTRDVSMMA
ncbi:phage tail tip lysozyme [Nocardia sp. NBC_00881]|uniref:phage tail tip lysozyme n=1 Tax=Nocardia sp. NBC_00881 TaxID=2975995 RepID=UPI00386BE4C4|nr:phage tail tip lysozyme [Nocardia sp. NBC_00881]